MRFFSSLFSFYMANRSRRRNFLLLVRFLVVFALLVAMLVAQVLEASLELLGTSAAILLSGLVVYGPWRWLVARADRAAQ